MGPSALGRLALCPPSHWLTLEARRQGLSTEAGEAAARGSLCHAHLPPATPFMQGQLTAEEIDWVQKARTYIAAKTLGTTCLSYEVRRDLVYKGCILLFGTLDVESIHEGRIVVIDAKFGRAELHPELLQWQLRAYAAMALQSEPTAKSADIYVYHVPTGIEYQGIVYREELDKLVTAIAGVIQAVNTSEGKAPTPHPAACHYCPAKSICPALKEEVTSLVKQDLAGEVEVSKLAKALDFAAVLGGWIEDVRRKARDVLAHGGAIPGWTLGKRRTRTITDIMGVMDAIHGQVEQSALLPVLKCGVGDLEALWVASFNGSKGPKEAKAMLEAKLLEFGALEVGEQQILKKDGSHDGE